MQNIYNQIKMIESNHMCEIKKGTKRKSCEVVYIFPASKIECENSLRGWGFVSDSTWLFYFYYYKQVAHW